MIKSSLVRLLFFALLMTSLGFSQTKSRYQQFRLTSAGSSGGKDFGDAVATTGDTIVVGAFSAVVGTVKTGAAYIFVKPAGGWSDMTETAELTASDGAAGAQFGNSVAISGDTVVVGAPFANNGKGAAYVFVKPPNGWTSMTETAKLLPSDRAFRDLFAYSVAISGNTVLVGAPDATVGSQVGEGAGYVFVRPSGGWKNMTETAKLTASDGQANIELGWSVAIDGSTALLGETSGSIAVGGCYVFVAPPTGWTSTTETAKLVASDGDLYANFGQSVSIFGATIVVSAPYLNNQAGALYVFVEPAGGWTNSTETARLVASDSGVDDRLGEPVIISGNVISALAPGHSLYSDIRGAIYLYVKPQVGWQSTTQTTEIAAPDTASLGLNVQTLVVGRPDPHPVGSNGLALVLVPTQ